MTKKKRIFALAPNEEIFITSSSCKYSLKIKNVNAELDVEEIDKINDSSNIVLTNLNFEELKRYILIEEYNQLIDSIELPQDLQEYVSKILKYHEDLIYGTKDDDMEKHQFQCISYY